MNSTKSAVQILHPNQHGNSGVNAAYCASTAKAQRVQWAREGVPGQHLDALTEAFEDLLLQGHSQAVAVRRLLPAVHDAMTDAHWTSLVERFVKRFSLPRDKARELAATARQHCHPNARPTFEAAAAKVWAAAQVASHEAYLARQVKAPLRASLGVAMLDAGVIK